MSCLRQSLLVGLLAGTCMWLQINRTLTLPLTLLLVVGLGGIEVAGAGGRTQHLESRPVSLRAPAVGRSPCCRQRRPTAWIGSFGRRLTLQALQDARWRRPGR